MHGRFPADAVYFAYISAIDKDLRIVVCLGHFQQTLAIYGLWYSGAIE